MDLLDGTIEKWFLVFWKANIDRDPWYRAGFWHEWWSFGGYHHVSAFGYCAQADVWVSFNPDRRGMHLKLIENSEAFDHFLARMMSCGSILKVRSGNDRRFLTNTPFTCVSAVKHLIGRGSGALTANALFRNLKAQNAEIVHVWSEHPS